MIKRFILPTFFSVSAIEILSQFFDWQTAHFVCKPLLLLLLILYYHQESASGNRIFIAALFFCWMGDAFLLFDYVNQLFFMAGLGSFLIAHILLFFSYRKSLLADDGRRGTQRIRLSFPLVVAGSGLVTILYPKLGDLKIPVMIYALALTLMVLQSIFRLGRTNTTSFSLVFTGAILFFISDSLLAINKFYQPLVYAGVLIMVTYIAAVYLITRGMIANGTKAS